MSRFRAGALPWATYDLANTIYSMNVVTLFFPQWVTVDRGREDLWFSVAFGASMLAVALTLPYLGLWSERGQRKRLLAVFTVLAVVSTAALGAATQVPGLWGLVLALFVFAVSNYGFQGGLVFYNALITEVSDPDTRGRVSGLGIGMGYLGSLVGLILVVPFVEGSLPGLNIELPFLPARDRSAAFLPTALLFGLFSIPLFLRVRDHTPPGPPPRWKEAWRTLVGSLLDTQRYPGVRMFLLANFLLLDAIHTAIVFIAVYAENVLGISDSQKAVLFILATLPALLGSLVAGWASDRIGPRRVLIVTAWMWVACPLVIATTSDLSVVYAAGAVIGVLLGSLWTTTRPYLLGLMPPGEEGRAFGLYALCNKSAAILGPLIWGLTVLLASSLGPARYRLAIVVLAGVAALGALVLHRVPETKRS